MPYRCFNRPPFRETFHAQDGWFHREGADTRLPKIVNIPFRMSKQCEYSLSDLGKADAGCAGCEWKQGEKQ